MPSVVIVAVDTLPNDGVRIRYNFGEPPLSTEVTPDTLQQDYPEGWPQIEQNIQQAFGQQDAQLVTLALWKFRAISPNYTDPEQAIGLDATL